MTSYSIRIASSMMAIVVLLVTLPKGFSNLISTINADDISYAGYTYGNYVGLSMYFDEIYPFLNNSLFRGFINNSKLQGNSLHLFHQSIHMPLGYKFNCSRIHYNNETVTCLFQLENQTDIIYAMKKYFSDFQGTGKAIMIGWDAQKINFTNKNYQSNFVKYFKLFEADAHIEVLDRGDELQQYYNGTKYNVETFVKAMDKLEAFFYWNYFSGAGISRNASSAWKLQSLDIYRDNAYAFTTYRIVLFQNEAQATIQNLLSQSFTALYLKNYFTIDGQYINFYQNNVAINEVKLIEGMGIDGVTNSYAAAIWALDFSLQFAMMRGRYIDFYNTFQNSYQSVLGPAPSFAPNPIYYGLLMSIYVQANYNDIFTVKAIGNNSNIKAYVFEKSSILIINKDTDSNKSGFVEIKITRVLKGLSCIYMQAPSLSATTGVTFGGAFWEGNNSNYQGAYEEFIYVGNSTTLTYKVNISYTQVAYCRYLIQQNASPPLRRGRSTKNAYHHITFSLLSLLLLIALN